MDKNNSMEKLLAIMTQLRNPEGGCPWDLEQSFSTIAPYTIEEAYEVADAIERNDMNALKDELGDLLLQVVFHSQIAKEMNLFAFEDVAKHVGDKMVHRHPHVFGDEKAETAMDVESRIWEERKALEDRKAELDSVLDDVPLNLPALLRAQKLQKRAARVGFEWDHAADVLTKLEEEIDEMREAIENKDKDEMLDELGDLFFVLTNFGRMLGIDCENAARHANNKFERRFRGLESDIKATGKELIDVSFEEKEKSWQAQKAKEKKKSAA